MQVFHNFPSLALKIWKIVQTKICSKLTIKTPEYQTYLEKCFSLFRSSSSSSSSSKQKGIFAELTLHDGDPYHIETSPLICSLNQWTGFYDRELHHERVKTSKYTGCYHNTLLILYSILLYNIWSIDPFLNVPF